VSEDVDILITRWCKTAGLIPPEKEFYLEPRAKMKTFLRNLFARVTFISSKQIRTGLLRSIAQHKKAGLTIVSLERAYLEDSEVNERIELTRTVDGSLEDVVIPSVRNGTPLKQFQFERLRGKEIALVDDVVFSGKTLIGTISGLHHCHANVHAVTAAVGVKEGVDNLKKATFGVIGMPDRLMVDCLDEFDDVSDQVCERDFYPGVPYSGRAHFTSDASFPYVLPLGRPDKWASIPEKELERFSVLCIDNTIALFAEIEKRNKRMITCAMVPRPVFGFPKNNTRFVSVLKETREKCLQT
jgi:hypothetical protein